jgi:hypothetical protein
MNLLFFSFLKLLFSTVPLRQTLNTPLRTLGVSDPVRAALPGKFLSLTEQKLLPTSPNFEKILPLHS